MRPVPRALFALLAASAVLATPLASGAYAGGKSSAVTGTITLRAKFHGGLWKKSLYIKLVKLRLTDFTLCAVWTRPAGETFDCEIASKRQLPEGTIMRLEQSPVAKAVKRPESPGWGMLGASPDAALGAVLSNLVSGNRVGTFKYRVTLRDRSNQLLVASNTLSVVWHSP
jgi:hypothetical protein